MQEVPPPLAGESQDPARLDRAGGGRTASAPEVAFQMCAPGGGRGLRSRSRAGGSAHVGRAATAVDSGVGGLVVMELDALGLRAAVPGRPRPSDARLQILPGQALRPRWGADAAGWRRPSSLVSAA